MANYLPNYNLIVQRRWRRTRMLQSLTLLIFKYLYTIYYIILYGKYFRRNTKIARNERSD
jgi:hypothetical protein